MELKSLSSLVGRGRSFFYRRHLRLQQAYQEVFHGNPSSEDQDLVLADILLQSGFTRVCGPDVSDTHLRQQEGKRELYGHIFSFLSLSEENVRALETAARQEAAMHEGIS